MVYFPPKFLDALIEGGRASYVGSDLDCGTEVLEELDDFGVAVDACAEDPDPFYDWQSGGLFDDPHEDLLQRIGALSTKGKR